MCYSRFVKQRLQLLSLENKLLFIPCEVGFIKVKWFIHSFIIYSSNLHFPLDLFISHVSPTQQCPICTHFSEVAGPVKEQRESPTQNGNYSTSLIPGRH